MNLVISNQRRCGQLLEPAQACCQQSGTVFPFLSSDFGPGTMVSNRDRAEKRRNTVSFFQGGYSVKDQTLVISGPHVEFKCHGACEKMLGFGVCCKNEYFDISCDY